MSHAIVHGHNIGILPSKKTDLCLFYKIAKKLQMFIENIVLVVFNHKETNVYRKQCVSCL